MPHVKVSIGFEVYIEEYYRHIIYCIRERSNKIKINDINVDENNLL